MSNANPEVDAWFEAYDNPQKDLAQEVRNAILEVDDRVSEAIKWKAPTFMFNGNIASFFPRSRQNVVLMFHTGAHLDDPHGILEGEGATARSARFSSSEDLAAKREGLAAVVRSWITTHQ